MVIEERCGALGCFKFRFVTLQIHVFLWNVCSKMVLVFRPSVRCRENGNNFATNDDFRSYDDGSTTWCVYYGDLDALGGCYGNCLCNKVTTLYQTINVMKLELLNTND